MCLDGRRLVSPIENFSQDTLILFNEISMLPQVSPTVKISEFILLLDGFQRQLLCAVDSFNS